VDAGELRTLGGTQAMPLTGQVLLVASRTNALFGGPTEASFVTGDDVVLYRTNLDSGFGPGLFQRSIGFELIAFAGLNPGDPVQLYWFPTLTASSSSPGPGATYGFYRHDAGLDGSASWVIPSDGSLVNLKFITASQGGSNPDELGYANHAIVRLVILSLAGAGTTNVVITWSAVSNLTYRVRYRTDFSSPWTNLVPDVTATNGAASATDNPGGAPQRLYQVLLVQ